MNNISVIIPVYNAAAFVEKAAESALMQPETKEIILVEDGSTDESLTICRRLAGKYEEVKLFTHPENKNKGAGASRNLGISMASADFIAFLDADDYFLPNRFKAERKIFEEQPETDGVYGALGFHYYSEEGKKKYQQQGFNKLTTLPGLVPPGELFLSLLWLHAKVNGHFSVNTLTVKRNVFSDKTETFNDLKLHEDTVFILQLSLNCKLQGGIIDEPVAMRGVHEDNRIVNRSNGAGSQLLMWAHLYQWAKRSANSKRLAGLFRFYMMRAKVLNSKHLIAFLYFGWYSITNNHFSDERMFFNPCCLHVFGKYYGNHIIQLKEKILKRTAGTFYTPSGKLMKVIQ